MILAKVRSPDTHDDSNDTHNHGDIASYGNDHAGDNDFTVDANYDD